jgi:glycosyltransferase 2 family protein
VSAAKHNVRLGALIAALAGLVGAAYLIFHVGFRPIFGAALSVDWGGFALLCLYGTANFVLLGFAWLTLVPPFSGHKAIAFCWGRAVRDCAGDVLPFSQLGGMVIGARAAMLRGIPQGTAFASTIVDVTMEMIGQIVFIVAGLVILAVHLPGTVSRVPMVQSTTVGIVVAVAGVAVFFVAQRRGFTALERLAMRFLPAAAAHAAAVDRAVHAIHAAPARMAADFSIHLLGWISAAFGTWLALALIGSPVPFAAAVAIESLLCAARSATPFVPASIGVQEAGYAVMMPLFGLPAEIGLAVSLLKRAREIAVGVPVLLSWQVAEGGHALRGRNREGAR